MTVWLVLVPVAPATVPLIVLRSIPELVWALVFVRVVGLGPIERVVQRLQHAQAHHVGLAVMGPFAAWEETIARLKANGDEIVQMATVAPGQEPQAMFAYVDQRQSLGHFTEFLWWSPRLNGLPTFPALQQEASS